MSPFIFTSMIAVEGLEYSYPGKTIHYPDFSVKPGENFAILGKSGTGKTTLLHLLSGLMKLEKGTIKIGDTNLESLNERERDHFRGEKVGIVFQKAHLLKSLNVSENLLSAQFFAGHKQKLNRVKEVLSTLDLIDKQFSKPSELSQGEAQRVSIARALMNKPQVIFADEPTSSLDDENCDKVLDLLTAEAEKLGASLVIVTHDQRVKERIKEGIKL